MSLSQLGRTVVVPVANPASARPLLAVAGAIARADAGRVALTTVVKPHAPSDERDRARRDLAVAEATARELGLDASGHVTEASAVTDGVLACVDEQDASLVVMGWRGASSTSNVFGELIDLVVGRSSVPLAIVRPGTRPFRRVLVPVGRDHLQPAGSRGLHLAASIAQRVQSQLGHPVTVLRTGERSGPLPPAIARLGDRIHHDPRRTDQAVAAFAGAEDLLVAPVAPTVSGLRAATTHLAWAAPDATLLVAVDVGPRREVGLAEAVDAATRTPAPAPSTADQKHPVRIVVTVRLPDDTSVTPEELDHVLSTAGATDHLMAWWPAGDPRPHVRATVTVQANGVNTAISAVMVAVHDDPRFRGAEISYDVDRGPPEDRDGRRTTITVDSIEDLLLTPRPDPGP